MLFDYPSAIIQVMLFALVPSITALVISLRIIKKKAQIKKYKKPQTEFEEILGF